jgi:hypothetical protein
MTEYDINLDDKYGQLAVIDVAAEAASHEPWFTCCEPDYRRSSTISSVSGSSTTP